MTENIFFLFNKKIVTEGYNALLLWIDGYCVNYSANVWINEKITMFI